MDVFSGIGVLLGSFGLAALAPEVPQLLRWCYRHWGKLLCLVFLALWVLSAVKMSCSIRYDPAQRQDMVDDFWRWMFLGTTMLVCLFPLAWEQPKKPKIPQPKALPSGRLSLPHGYFMPYCVCPQCDSEALHWIKPMREPRQYRFVHADVVRECRTCKHAWGQQVGLAAHVLESGKT